MNATMEMVEEWKKQYLKTHTYPSTETYYSFIKRFVTTNGIVVTQKTVDNFRDDNMSCPASSALKVFFRFLVRKRGFDSYILNIRFDKNKPTVRFPKSIPLSDVEKLIDVMPGLRDKVMTRTIFECGLRISEALNLLWENLNYNEWLQTQSEYGKMSILNTKRGKFRVVPVSNKLMRLLYDLCALKTSTGIPIGKLVFDYGIKDYIFRKEFSPDKTYMIIVYMLKMFIEKNFIKYLKKFLIEEYHLTI